MRLRRTRASLTAALAILLAAVPAAPAQESALLAPFETQPRDLPRRAPVRTATPPEIDGTLDDAAWEEAAVIDDLRQVEPVEGAEPSERTEIRVLFDEDFLYVAFRCYDDDPSGIIATQMRRDVALGSDDHIAFIVDPFFDRRNGFYFEMNAVGSKGDGLIEDNSRFRKEWDGIWYGKASIDEQGWVAEMAIPFKTLSFNPDTTEWSFNALRFIRRRNERLRWASPSQNISFNSFADAGILEGITDITQGIGLDVKPFFVLTGKRDHDRDENGVDVDGGVDMFYKITPSLTLALTVNTDFAETEVDERRVNLTRFPLFFPEKRDFFLQDAGIFDFGGIRRNPLPFFSRRIGLDGRGETVDILAGVKLTGRVQDLNIGLLDVQMQHDSTLGNKNLFVGRAAFNVLEQSSVGAIITAGDPATPEDNVVGGVDYTLRTTQFGGDRTLESQGFVLVSDSSGEDGTDHAAGFRVSYPNDRVNWRAGFTRIGDEYDAALGFVPRRGINEYFANWRHRWRPGGGFIRTIDSGLDLFLVTDLSNTTESRRLSFELIDIGTEAGDSFEVEYVREREVLDEDFEIHDDVTIPVGNYHFDRYAIDLRTSSGRPVSGRLRYGGGDFYDGTRDDYLVGAEWRVSRHLFLGAEFELNDVNLPGGDFITRLVRGRANVYFTPDISWTTFVQWDNDSDTVGLNSRFQWIVQPGNEIFVVLNQSIDRDGSSLRVLRTELTTKVGGPDLQVLGPLGPGAWLTDHREQAPACAGVRRLSARPGESPRTPRRIGGTSGAEWPPPFEAQLVPPIRLSHQRSA
ncbi:MAG: carbohydrate binding family 9 domain-containing protein [Planctomycetota bacterium]